MYLGSRWVEIILLLVFVARYFIIWYERHVDIAKQRWVIHSLISRATRSWCYMQLCHGHYFRQLLKVILSLFELVQNVQRQIRWWRVMSLVDVRRVHIQFIRCESWFDVCQWCTHCVCVMPTEGAELGRLLEGWADSTILDVRLISTFNELISKVGMYNFRWALKCLELLV